MGSKALLSITVGTILLIPLSYAFATSGACSDHGGVNCAAGAQPDGMVICNDGWLGSSVSYASMVECEDATSLDYTPTDTYCPPPILLSGECTLQSEVQQWQSLCQQEESSERAACFAEGLGNSSSCVSDSSSEACTQATNCQAEVNDYNEEEQTYQSCIASEAAQITSDETQQENATCAEQEGQYSTFDQTSNSCVCEAGYWLDFTNNQCEKPETACTNELGPNSYPVGNSGGKCQCDTNATTGKANYAIGSDGQCDAVQEPVHTISASAYGVASGGASCRVLSGQDEADCDLYVDHQYDYDWQVTQPSTTDTNSAAVTPATVTTNPASIVSLPSIPVPPVPKNSPPQTPKEFVNDASASATNSVAFASSSAASTTTASQVLPTPARADGLLDVLGHLFGWLNPRSWF